MELPIPVQMKFTRFLPRIKAKHFHLICLSGAYKGAVSLTLTKLENVFLIHKGVLQLTGVVLVGTFQPFIKKEKSPGVSHSEGDFM